MRGRAEWAAEMFAERLWVGEGKDASSLAVSSQEQQICSFSLSQVHRFSMSLRVSLVFL